MDASEWSLFMVQAIRAAGLDGHPKAKELYELAWENGHEGGKEEVLNHLLDLADMELGNESDEVE